MKRCAAIALLLAGSAHAWPVEMQHDVEPGSEKFVKLSVVDWVEVEDPKILTAEVMESGELLLTGLKPGRTLVLLYAEGRAAVWRVRVGQKPVGDGGLLAAALKACPGVKHLPDAYDKLVGDVKDEPCRQALLKLFQTDTFIARELDLSFEVKTMQNQLKDIQRGLDEKKTRVLAQYFGGSLELSGTVTLPALKAALWESFKRSAGRVVLENKLEVPAPDGDASSKEN